VPTPTLSKSRLRNVRCAINHRCLIRTQDGHRVVIGAGVVLAQYAVGDRMAEAHAMIHLVEQHRGR
jgi:hypothetical protein